MAPNASTDQPRRQATSRAASGSRLRPITSTAAASAARTDESVSLDERNIPDANVASMPARTHPAVCPFADRAYARAIWDRFGLWHRQRNPRYSPPLYVGSGLPRRLPKTALSLLRDKM